MMSLVCLILWWPNFWTLEYPQKKILLGIFIGLHLLTHTSYLVLCNFYLKICPPYSIIYELLNKSLLSLILNNYIFEAFWGFLEQNYLGENREEEEEEDANLEEEQEE